MKNKSDSYCNSPDPDHGNSAYNGPFQIHHTWHCPCIWCLQGIR